MFPKETFEPIEQVLQVHYDTEPEEFYRDFHIDNIDPLDIYSRADFCDNDTMDEIYGVKGEFNTLTYDLDLHLDNSELDISYQIHDNVDTIQDNPSSKSMLKFFPSISKAELSISTFVCT